VATRSAFWRSILASTRALVRESRSVIGRLVMQQISQIRQYHRAGGARSECGGKGGGRRPDTPIVMATGLSASSALGARCGSVTAGRSSIRMIACSMRASRASRRCGRVYRLPIGATIQIARWLGNERPQFGEFFSRSFRNLTSSGGGKINNINALAPTSLAYARARALIGGIYWGRG
jgi:hypothetical protein